MIDAVTTNKTDFFREAEHFDYLVGKIVPAAAARNGAGSSGRSRYGRPAAPPGRNHIPSPWSSRSNRLSDPSFSYRIFASDLSSQVLEKARQAVYDEAKVETVPMSFKKKYMLKSREKGSGLVRMKPEIRARVCFARHQFHGRPLSGHRSNSTSCSAGTSSSISNGAYRRPSFESSARAPARGMARPRAFRDPNRHGNAAQGRRPTIYEGSEDGGGWQVGSG